MPRQGRRRHHASSVAWVRWRCPGQDHQRATEQRDCLRGLRRRTHRGEAAARLAGERRSRGAPGSPRRAATGAAGDVPGPPPPPEPALLRKVDAVTVRVPDLDRGLEFYSQALGHRLRWRYDGIGQAGLALPDGDTEIVLATS